MNSIASRRHFMKLLGATAALSTASLFPINSLFASSVSLSKETQMLLGTMVTIVLEDSSDSLRKKGLSLAFDHIAMLETQLSRYNTASPLFTLNKTGSVKNPPLALSLLIKESQIHEDKSQGFFNITILPILEYFKEEKNRNNIDTEGYHQALSRMNSATSIVVEDDRISFNKADTNITLDAIAKGYIVDSVAEILFALGIERYYINAGGDIRVGGSAIEKDSWSVGIQSPFDPHKILASFPLTNGAVATSGIYEQYYSKDKTINHLIVPQQSTRSSIISTTVKAPTAMLADVLATTLSLMPVKDALQYINNYDCAACFVVDNVRTYKSALWEYI
ncbi:MAG: FAD:protein FMN transferase [Desulfovibrionaceae bacterium]